MPFWYPETELRVVFKFDPYFVFTIDPKKKNTDKKFPYLLLLIESEG